MKMLALYFGTDEVTFTVTSTNPNANPNSQTYASFIDTALDVVEARIVHAFIPASQLMLWRRNLCSQNRFHHSNLRAHEPTEVYGYRLRIGLFG